jgi:hypothetical protein
VSACHLFHLFHSWQNLARLAQLRKSVFFPLSSTLKDLTPKKSTSPPRFHAIRITTRGQIKSYVKFSLEHLSKPACQPILYKPANESALNKVVSVVEIVKREWKGKEPLGQRNYLAIDDSGIENDRVDEDTMGVGGKERADHDELEQSGGDEEAVRDRNDFVYQSVLAQGNKR